MEIGPLLVHLYPGAEPVRDYVIAAGPDGTAQILAWRLPVPQPTPEDLAAAWQQHGRIVLLKPVRAERNLRLAASDWTQLLDAPLSPSQTAAWRAYRQQLRDFPATVNLDQPFWPALPG